MRLVGKLVAFCLGLTLFGGLSAPSFGMATQQDGKKGTDLIKEETARLKAEAARLKAENDRKEQEAARLKAENDRKEQEAARKEQEAARLEAENQKRLAVLNHQLQCIKDMSALQDRSPENFAYIRQEGIVYLNQNKAEPMVIHTCPAARMEREIFGSSPAAPQPDSATKK